MILATTPLDDPLNSSTVLSSVRWIQDTMLGEVASVVAMIAVAGVGALMLTGRTDLRRGLTVVLGCFVLFGAATIAAGIRKAVDVADGGTVEVVAPALPTAPLPPKAGSPNPTYDPYAGASVFVGPR